jgi:hypothetical protein
MWLKTLGTLFLRLLSVGGIAGLIGLCITGTICARYLQHGPEEIPQVFTYALTSIIGFYFGTKTTGNGEESEHSRTTRQHT